MSSLSASLSRQTTISKKSDFNKDAELKSSVSYKNASNINIDCTKALEPTRKKLTTLETQRIMSVLDNCIKQSEIITAIPSVLNNIEDMSIVLTRQLIFLLDNYKMIKLKLDVVISKLDAIRGIRQNRKQEIEEYQREQSLASEDFWTHVKSTRPESAGQRNEFGFISYSYSPEEIERFQNDESNLIKTYEELSEKLKFATRCLFIGFKANPAALTALTTGEKDWKIKRSPGDSMFISKLLQLKDILTLRLMTTPTEQNENHSYLRQMNEKFKANQMIINDLEIELKAAQEHKKEQISEKNDTIKKFQAEIHQVEKLSDENIKKTKLEMERQKEIDEKNSESVCQKLQQEIFQKKTEYNNILSEGRSGEKEMRANKIKKESALETNLQNYDTLMRQIQTEYEMVDEQYTEEKTQLYEMEERFKTIEEEYLKIMEEKRIAEEKRAAAAREEEILTKAVITIQAFWRSYKVRKGVRGSTRKGKGKGKKKK